MFLPVENVIQWNSKSIERYDVYIGKQYFNHSVPDTVACIILTATIMEIIQWWNARTAVALEVEERVKFDRNSIENQIGLH